MPEDHSQESSDQVPPKPNLDGKKSKTAYDLAAETIADLTEAPLEADDSSHADSAASAEQADTLLHRAGENAGSGSSGSGTQADGQQGLIGQLGRYHITRELGRGNMGTVYLARDTQLNRDVALKVPRFSEQDHAEQVSRFHREARAMATVRHGGICPVFDVGEVDDVHYLTMAYIEGHPLSDLTKDGQTFPGEQVAELICKIALALQEAHSRGIVHRDLKPANIMIDQRNEPIIMDFGLARLQAENEVRLTQTGSMLGTPIYMSPEQVDGEQEKIGPATDIYSLGVICYQMLCGQLPFSGTFGSLMYQIKTKTPPPIVEMGAEDVDPQLEAICMKAMSKEQEDRQPTAAALADELRDYLKQAAKSKSPEGERTAPELNDLLQQLESNPVLKAALLESQQVETQQKPAAASQCGALSPKRWQNDRRVWGAVAGVLLLVLASVAYLFKSPSSAPPNERQGARSKTVEPGTSTTAESGTSQEQESPTPSKVWKSTPEHEEFVAAVAKLKPVAQIESVRERLQQLNPGFDGELSHKIENGHVVYLQVATNELTDISPVRALTHLERLSCNGSAKDKGQLTDLSPLKGMPLNVLSCYHTRVASLSPLQGMRLNYLNFAHSGVADLSPLKGMPLTTLYCGDTRISDLSSLEGMPLSLFDCQETSVSDLSPLKDSPVVDLHCGSTRVTDLAPLREMKLTNFNCIYTRVADLSPLRGMPLRGLACDVTLVSNLSPLEGMPLTSLACAQTPVDDLTPLRGMRLTYLNCGLTKIADLSPLQGMPLKQLYLSDTRVADLSPLQGMKLNILDCANTPISDLSPLRGMPLEVLTSGVELYDPTYRLLLKALPLKTINRIPAAEFLTRFEARHQAADEFVNSTATLPIENQIVAVRKRLSELASKIHATYKANLDSTKTTGKAVTAVTLTISRHPHDLTPLMALTDLKKLTISGGAVYTDLSPLIRLPLEELTCPAGMARKNAPMLKEIKTLKNINGQPASEFWKARTAWKPTPEHQQFVDKVAKLKPEEQIEAVRERLKLLNTGFDGKLEHKIEDGQVVKLGFITDEVTDISPVKALPNLKLLRCNGSVPGKGKLADLSPLQGMKLTQLGCDNTGVADLSPLKGMPLTHLSIASSPIVDLSPLQGMKLIRLAMSHTRVSDLSPLKEMPLTSLDCSYTATKRLAPLEGMPLEFLNCGITPVSDLTPLQGMPLTQLHCEHTRVTELSPLKQSPLRQLNCNNTRISKLSPLSGLPLTEFYCAHTRVSDLSPLAGMKLTSIGLEGSQVADISPLQGMPLRSLSCFSTPVADLSPLQNTPAISLSCDVRLYDLAEEMLLKSLSLKFLSGRPRDEFWQQHAARREAAQAFAESTSKLSTEKRIAAVSEQLSDLALKRNPTLRVSLETTRTTGDVVTEAKIKLDSRPHDVTPLMAFSNLKVLTITGGAAYTDLSPLTRLPLAEFTSPAAMARKNAPVLKQIKTLKTINGQPAAEFWDSVSTGK